MSLLARIKASLTRDADLPLSQKLKKGLRFLTAAATAPIHLRDCDYVGKRPRTMGAPIVQNLGRIEIGDDAIINADYVPVRFRSGPGATVVIGSRAAINFGATIDAAAKISIGDDISLGPYVTIQDHDGEEDDSPTAVTIGNNVWLATRVTVKKGVSIGDGSVITAGSVVSTNIPAGVIAGGAPARVLGYRDGRPLQATNGISSPSPSPPPPAPDACALLIADFSIQELSDHLLAADAFATTVASEVAPFDQVVQTLHTLAASPTAFGEADFALVWTRAEALDSIKKLLAGEPTSTEEMDADVDRLAELVKRAAASMRFVFVASWVMPPHHRGFGMRDLKRGGAASALMRMNLRLAEALEPASNVHLLDTARWLGAGGREAVSQKLWYLGKIGFSTDVLQACALDIKAAIRGVRGRAKKLVVLDLDDTLWGGIVGDAGWQNLRLGGHDGVGEAFVDFQRELKALSRQGIALALVSKNEESVALEAIASHPEMVLKMDDVSAYRINWRDKAKNVAEIAAELNLGLQSIVFIDDNPIERARVREALPEVFVPEWPKDPMLYASALHDLRCFDAPVLSREDLDRTRQYAAERKREELKTSVGSLDEWLLGLGIRVRFERLGPSNLARTTQLLNKTNQMNLSTRRLGETELTAWASGKGREVWAVSVSDKLGDAGLTGILGIEVEGARLKIIDYVLSCRVMGRKVEETIVATAIHRARQVGAKEVVAQFIATKKNMPCHSFWKGSGFSHDEAASTFTWDVGSPYPFPACVAVEGISEGARVEVQHGA